MIVLRQEAGGDLDLILILSVIGEPHFANRTRTDVPTYDALGTTETTKALSINTYSIVRFTKAPRESVRRKVAKLIELEWVVCDKGGSPSPTAKSATALAKGTDTALEFIQFFAKTLRDKDADR